MPLIHNCIVSGSGILGELTGCKAQQSLSVDILVSANNLQVILLYTFIAFVFFPQNRGKRMIEGAHINRSLLALGNCINALSKYMYIIPTLHTVRVCCVQCDCHTFGKQ